VDGVYSADPKRDPSAKKLSEISYQEALVQGLKVVDATAFSLCMDNKMPMRVFGMEDVAAALLGKQVGTRVKP
jgi:uridylate kinase